MPLVGVLVDLPISEAGAYAKHSIRVDQGSEFISRDLDLRPSARCHSGLLAAGKPSDNSFIESFIDKLRAKCLSTHRFMCLDDARTKREDWRRGYNGSAT